VFVSDFHREQAWDRWLDNKGIEYLAERSKVMSLLRNIAKSETLEQCESSTKALKESPYWREGTTLKKYFSKFWMNNKEVCIMVDI